MPPKAAPSFNYLLSFSAFSQVWLAIPQLVLQADWQEVWHSPHPPFFADSQRLRVSRVLILFIVISSDKFNFNVLIISHHAQHVKTSKRNPDIFLHYSVLSATTGSFFAALLDGIIPAKSVSSTLIPISISAAGIGSIALRFGIPVSTFNIRFIGMQSR